MGLSPLSSEASIASEPKNQVRRRGGWLLLGGAVVAVALLIFVVWELSFFPPKSPTRQFEWLTSAQAARAYHPKSFIKERYWMLMVLAKLRHDPPGSRIYPIFQFQLNLIPASPSQVGTMESAVLGPASATNLAGYRAWVLSLNSWTNAQQHFLQAAGARPSSAWHYAEDGGDDWSPWGTAWFKGRPSAEVVKLGIRSSGGDAGLVVDYVAGSGPAGMSPANWLSGTNFEFAFLANVPVGGGVVIECLDTNGPEPQHYWFTVGPVMPVPVPARAPAKTPGKP